MDIEKELKNIGEKMDKFQADSQKRARIDTYMNQAYVMWGFSLATTSLAVINPQPATIAIAIAFLVGGFILLRRAKLQTNK